LDPVKNEAFVAQLAQFSQLEATTSMDQTLKTYVNSMAGERMMSSTNMIGKTVAVPDAPAVIQGDKPAQGFITLPNGAEGVKLQVYNDKGQLVATQVMGAQKMGDMPWVWDGSGDAGNRVPDGNYFFKATVVSQGKTTTPSVNVLSTVTGVNQAIDKSIMLEVAGGKSVKLTDVQRIGS
jgi:flagellar basal-body rod modification protein FlgD